MSDGYGDVLSNLYSRGGRDTTQETEIEIEHGLLPCGRTACYVPNTEGAWIEFETGLMVEIEQ